MGGGPARRALPAGPSLGASLPADSVRALLRDATVKLCNGFTVEDLMEDARLCNIDLGTQEGFLK